MIKRMLLPCLMLVFTANMVFSQIDKSFYFPGDTTVNANIPHPGYYSGHRFGWWHFSYDQVAGYLVQLAEHSDRVAIQEYGRTHENRPLYLLTITSPENHQQLEKIRKAHLDYINGKNTTYADQDMPLIVWLGYSVHGNESSAGNASMLTAYYLASSESEDVHRTLDNTIVLIDPVLNPDGFNRAAQWSNMHIRRTQVKDQRDRQFREDWPGGRTNHYWFDLNRDWMPAQHPETQARLKPYHKWKPHIVTDHHEMGSNSTFFFQPGEPERVNPMTPEKNYELTRTIGSFHAKALDRIGSLYFSEESFDDFYYGKGSTYPDVNGGIGILFEQGRVMGQVIDNIHGELTFARAVRNQFTVSLSTLEAALDQKDVLKDYQRRFFDVSDQVKQDDIKGYLVGTDGDPARLNHFIRMLDRHDIRVHELKKPYKEKGRTLSPGEGYVVSLDQIQYRFIKSLFDRQTEYEDSIFYDISTWTMPLAFNLDYAAVTSERELDGYKGNRVTSFDTKPGQLIGNKSQVGYLVKGSHYYIHQIIHELQDEGMLVKVATESFQAATAEGEVPFKPGAVFIPSRFQKMDAEDIHARLERMAVAKGVNVYSLETALTRQGTDLGSRNFVPLEQRSILMVAGEGTSSYSGGEIWHLLDHRFRVPAVLIKPDALGQTNLFDFNTLVLPDGRYGWDDDTRESIRQWVRAGGVVVAMERANEWLSEKNFITMTRKKRPEDNPIQKAPYNQRGNRRRAQSISGVILKAEVDPTHPLGFGIHQTNMPVFKDNSAIYERPENPYEVPVGIGHSPLMSGYLSDENLRMIENTTYCQVHPVGRGAVISFTADPNFRAFWYGTNRLFMNALFFGSLL